MREVKEQVNINIQKKLGLMAVKNKNKFRFAILTYSG